MPNFRLFSSKEIYRQKEEGAETPNVPLEDFSQAVSQSVDSQTGRHQFTLTTFQIDERDVYLMKVFFLLHIPFP